MAPLPVTSTARYVVHYTCGANEHTQLWRSDGPASPSAMATFLDALWSAVDGILFLCNITDLVFYANGSPIGNSVGAAGFVGNTYGSGTPSNVQQALYLDFVARSTGGRRFRSAFFSPVGSDPSWRFYDSENPAIENAIIALEGNSDLVAIDGLPLVWKPYANNGFNAYWQRANRS